MLKRATFQQHLWLPYNVMTILHSYVYNYIQVHKYKVMNTVIKSVAILPMYVSTGSLIYNVVLTHWLHVLYYVLCHPYKCEISTQCSVTRCPVVTLLKPGYKAMYCCCHSCTSWMEGAEAVLLCLVPSQVMLCPRVVCLELLSVESATVLWAGSRALEVCPEGRWEGWGRRGGGRGGEGEEVGGVGKERRWEGWGRRGGGRGEGKGGRWEGRRRRGGGRGGE